ncbi:MAG: EpsG family protein [Muribaculaceae bacterium]|nr:EpsG family protein [Muribaculaceae bacterium]
MDTGFFSTTIWLNITSVFAILYAIYICTKSNNNLIRGSKISIFPILIIIITIIYIGTRPIWCYADTHLYTLMFNLVQSGVWPELKNNETEPLWTAIEYGCIEFTTASGWLFIIAILYVIGMSIAAYRWLPRHFLIALIFLFTAFSFWPYGTNGIRNGMATSIAMLGLSFFCRTKKELITGYLLLMLASLTHKSCLLTVVAATAALFLKNTKINISIWLICIVLGLLFQEQFKSFFSLAIDDKRMEYYLNIDVTKDVFSNTGFRWDFILYSALPILIGWFSISNKKITDKSYLFLLHTYIFSNSFWVLINTMSYSNRFAYLSWFLYPIVILYPFCKFKIIRNQSLILGILLIILTLFTYIML